MRPAAHVDIFFMKIQPHGLLVRHVVNQAQLVVFTARPEHLDNLRARRHLLNDVVIPVNQLGHALLDGYHVFWRKGAIDGDVVIKALIDHRTDHHFGTRIQLLDRVPYQVRTGVTDDLLPFVIPRGDDLQRRIGLDQIAGIDQPAVRPCQPG